MREMNDALLKYSRVETKGDPFEPVDLDTTLSEVQDDLQLQIEESGATITAESLPHVHGNPGQLRQVLQNLVDNAIEYSGGDPPEVHVGAERNGDEWVISVRDAGIGIGLALCQRIVERHGGDIWVESEPGEGGAFYVTLPPVDHDAQSMRLNRLLGEYR